MPKINLWLLIPALLVCSLSVWLLLSIDPLLARKQTIFFLIGLLVFFVVSKLKAELLLYFRHYIYLLVLLFVVLTHFISQDVRGSSRWITFGFVNFQPSEFAKLALIISLSYFLYIYKKNKLDFKGLVLSAFIFIPLFFAVLWQPDLGTALALLAVFISMLFVKGVGVKHLFLAFILFGISSNIIWNSLHVYQKNRILTFINPSLDPLGSGYNVLQSKIAVGSGMLFGKGFGLGTQSKLKFLPEYHTDFIFASFSEEWGLFGVSFLLLFYFVLLLSILKLLSRTQNAFEVYILVGVFSMLLFQIIVNIGMNLGMMPVTGIPLPLMSYGGSSIISVFASLGVVNSIYNRRHYD